MKLKNNTLFILTSSICVLPMLLSLIIYSDLPEQIAIHWQQDIPDQFISKNIVVFGLPVFFLFINLFSKIQLFNDPKRKNTSQVLQVFSIWTPPLLSLIIIPITLFMAMGVTIPISLIFSIVVGFVLLLCGNYLPKNRQNYTIGILLPWTLNNVKIWNKTQRITGYMYMFGGCILLIKSFIFPETTYITISIIITIFLFPILYSFLLYKKGDTYEKQ